MIYQAGFWWRFRRLFCLWAGSHRMYPERRGYPVTSFMYCIRCGKLGERIA